MTALALLLYVLYSDRACCFNHWQRALYSNFIILQRLPRNGTWYVFPVTGLGTSSPRHVFHTSSEWHSTCLHCNRFSAGGNDGIRLMQKEGQKTRSSTVGRKESCKIGQLLISVCLVVTIQKQLLQYANNTQCKPNICILYTSYRHPLQLATDVSHPSFHEWYSFCKTEWKYSSIASAPAHSGTKLQLQFRFSMTPSISFSQGKFWFASKLPPIMRFVSIEHCMIIYALWEKLQEISLTWFGTRKEEKGASAKEENMKF